MVLNYLNMVLFIIDKCSIIITSELAFQAIVSV